MNFNEFIESLAPLALDRRYRYALKWLREHKVSFAEFKQIFKAVEIYEDFPGENIEIRKTYNLFKTWFECEKNKEAVFDLNTFGRMFLKGNPLFFLDIEKRCELLETFLNHLPKNAVNYATNLTDLFLVSIRKDATEKAADIRSRGILVNANLEQRQRIVEIWNQNEYREQIKGDDKVMFGPFKSAFIFDPTDEEFLYYEKIAQQSSEIDYRMEQIRLAQEEASHEDSYDEDFAPDTSDDEEIYELKEALKKDKADEKEDQAAADKAAAQFKELLSSTRAAIRKAKSQETSRLVQSPTAQGLTGGATNSPVHTPK